MTLLQWTPQLDINVSMIDDQHRNLVRLLNETHRIAVTGEDQESLDEILEELELYTLNHFQEEEALMRKLSYEFIDQHRAEHQVLADQVQVQREAFARGEGDPIELLEFMKRWLLTHLAGADRHIGDYIRQHGMPR